MFGSLPLARNAALKMGLIEVPVIHGKLPQQNNKTQWLPRLITLLPVVLTVVPRIFGHHSSIHSVAIPIGVNVF